MALDCFISINIIQDKIIINPDGVPIIFYWDGQSDMIEDFINDEKFSSILKENILSDKKKYDTTYLSLIYVSTLNNRTSFKTKKISIQQLYKLKDLNNNIVNEYLDDIFFDLYEMIFKEQYSERILREEQSDENSIKDIYKLVKENSKKKVSEETFINYVLSKLNDNTKLSIENKNFLIEKLKDIIRESV